MDEGSLYAFVCRTDEPPKDVQRSAEPSVQPFEHGDEHAR